MGGMDGPSAACGGLEEAGGVPAEADVPGWDSEEEDGSDEEALTASKPRRRAAGETAPGGVCGELGCGGVCSPLEAGGSAEGDPSQLYSACGRVGGDAAWTGLVRGEGDEPLSSGGLSGPREGDDARADALGRRVPQRPFTQGASSSTTPAAPPRTGDCERREGGSGPRGAGVELMGEGREFRLGLRGARPDGA